MAAWGVFKAKKTLVGSGCGLGTAGSGAGRRCRSEKACGSV